ncbi:MAG: tetratricopeptide repeat protein [Alphaproteobacteria bacterium]
MSGAVARPCLGAFACVLVAVLCAAFAGAASAQGRKPTSSYPSNEQPMYGGVARTPAEQESDRKYIVDATVQASRALASDKVADLGFRDFFKGDLTAAIMRFNQAYLLEPENGDAYHGMAMVVYDRDDNQALAEQMFKIAIAKANTSIGAWADYGRLLLLAKRAREAVAILDAGLARPRAGNSNPEGAANARALLALASADLGQFPRACREAKAVPPLAQKELLDGVSRILALPECRGA